MATKISFFGGKEYEEPPDLVLDMESEEGLAWRLKIEEDVLEVLRKASSTAEKIVFLEEEIAGKGSKIWTHTIRGVTFTGSLEGEYLQKFTRFLQKELDRNEKIFHLESSAKKGSVSPDSEEQTKAYKNVYEIFKKKGKPFWSGSLSDFVHVIDTLAVKGFLKANELEEAIAETFEHKGKGKKRFSN